MPVSPSVLRHTIVKYYSFNFFKNFAFFSAVLVPFFTTWGGISLTQVQLLQSWFMLWVFLFEVPTGAVADYVGRKHSLALGAFVAVAGALVYGSAPQFSVFLIGEMLLALGMALISGADQALMYDALKAAGREGESKAVFGKSHSFHMLGILLSSLIGSAIAARWGLNAPMLLSAIPFFIAGAIAWTLPEAPRTNIVSEGTRYLTIIQEGFSYFYRHKHLRIIALNAIIVASAAYFVIWLYQPLLTAHDVPIKWFGVVHAFFVATEIVIAANFLRLEKVFGGTQGFIRGTAAITGIGFLLAAFMPSVWTVFALVAFSGGFGLTRMEYFTAHMNDLIPSDKRATVLSSISMFRRFALVFLNPLVGFTADHSLRLALLGMGILSLFALFIPSIVAHKKQDAPEE